MSRTDGTDTAPGNSNPGTPTFETVTGIEGFARAALEVVSAARYQLAMMSVDLDRRLFGSEAFVDNLREFVLQHRRARLRVLVHDPAAAVRNSVRLIEFGRLLSSRVEFRAVPASRHKLREEFLIADETALLHRGSPELVEARHYADAPMVARSQLRGFNTCWEESGVAREMVALGL